MKKETIIDNKWKIVEICEYGGQAQIYKVKPVCGNIEDSYALKFLHKQTDSERRQRMYCEVENLRKLQNQHIQKIIATNVEKYKGTEKLYYVYQYIEGCTLEQFVSENEISFAQAISFIVNFVDVIRYCHENNVIHRDIKPDNIMIIDNDISNFILIDFGISFNINADEKDITSINQQLGNRFLILPELIGGTISEKRLIQSDLTQCCGVLIYILTKQIPHSIVDGNNLPPHRRLKIMEKIKEITPNDIIQTNLVALFDKGFAINTEDRYKTACEMLSDLVSLNEKKVNMYGGTIMDENNNSGSECGNVQVIKYSQLINELNPNPEICNPSGLQLPLETNVTELINYGIALNSRDQKKITKYYNEHDFSTAAEKIWTRSISILRNRLLALGEDFVADMVETDDLDYVRNLPAFKVICIAHELGFIDKSGKRKLISANNYYNFYLGTEDGVDEEMPKDEANIIIKACISYILYNNESTYGLQFNDFREKLKTSRITEIFSDDTAMFQTCPYFYLKTTVRSLIKLLKETEGIEFENITTNLGIIIPKIWQRLKTEEKIALADAYTYYVNIGDYTRIDALNKVLLKVQGFDYVKENVRSRTFITVANKLVDTHFAPNNFYNEPAVIKTLEGLGTSFPRLALKSCITSILYVKLGNSYNTCWDAEVVADRLLDRLTSDEWYIYLERYLKEEEYLLECIYGSNKVLKMYTNWKLLVKKYNLAALNINNSDIQKLLH